MKLLLANVLLAFGFISSLVGRQGVLSIQDKIEFRNAMVENKFPEGIVFRIEICGRPAASNVIFTYQVTGDWGWNEKTWTIDEGQTSDGCDKRKYFLKTQQYSIPPFATVQYFWSVVEDTELTGRSPRYSYRYKDKRYTWKTIQDENLAILWHDRPDTFGEDVKYIAFRAYNDQAQFYSSVLEEPITIVISNTTDEFFSWRDEVNHSAGVSFSEMFLTVQVVEDEVGYYDWLSDVIPHEISHIYFNHLVKRYSGASDWLDEGLATYNEYTDHSNEWDILRAAYTTDGLLSLADLEYDFGEDDEKIDLAYAQSYYAVLYMDEFYGKDAIANLLYEYSKGTAALAAFEKSFGKDPEEFEHDFVAWLGERLKTPPPNTELPEPSQLPVQTAIQVSIPKKGVANSLTISFFLVLLFLSTLGFLFALHFLKPRRAFLKRRKKTKL